MPRAFEFALGNGLHLASDPLIGNASPALGWYLNGSSHESMDNAINYLYAQGSGVLASEVVNAYADEIGFPRTWCEVSENALVADRGLLNLNRKLHPKYDPGPPVQLSTFAKPCKSLTKQSLELDSQLLLSSSIGDFEQTKCLLKKGANPNTVDPGKNSVLHLSIAGKHENVAELLISHGANVNARGEFGLSPLHEASQYSRPSFVRRLLNLNADVNAVNDAGVTPLMIATYYCRPQIVKLLLRSGASKNNSNREGSTASDFAKSRHCTEAITA